MRPAIESKNRKGDYIEVGVYKRSEVKKAYGHNSGFKGHPAESKMKKHRREFIPAPNKKFKESIMNRVDQRLNELKRGQEETELEQLRTTTVGEVFSAFEAAGVADRLQVGSTEAGSGSLFTFPTIGSLLRELGDG